MMRKSSATNTSYKKIASRAVISLFFVLLMIFTYSKTKHIWTGIPLLVSSPKTYSSTYDSLVSIAGSAPKAVKLSINGNNTFVGEDGSFSYPIPIHSGYNEIHILAEDKFENTIEKKLYIHGIEKIPDDPPGTEVEEEKLPNETNINS